MACLVDIFLLTVAIANVCWLAGKLLLMVPAMTEGTTIIIRLVCFCLFHLSSFVSTSIIR